MTRIDPFCEMLQLLGAAGPELWFEARAAHERGPDWAVFIGVAERITLEDAPVEVLARLADLRPGQSLAVALPIEEIIDGLDLEGRGARFEALAEEIREVPPADDCRLVVVTRGGVHTLWVPAASTFTPIHVGHA